MSENSCFLRSHTSSFVQDALFTPNTFAFGKRSSTTSSDSSCTGASPSPSSFAFPQTVDGRKVCLKALRLFTSKTAMELLDETNATKTKLMKTFTNLSLRVRQERQTIMSQMSERQIFLTQSTQTTGGDGGPCLPIKDQFVYTPRERFRRRKRNLFFGIHADIDTETISLPDRNSFLFAINDQSCDELELY